ncbi:MAG: prepilin peptidase [Candidatus Shapirobacteria bacterium]
MIITLGVLIFVLGLCFGSFVNMLEYRLARKYKLISKSKFLISNNKRSFCDGCGKKLGFFENIPVLSWLIQKGRTKCCNKKLPLSYPIVELLMGILFFLFFLFKIFPNLNSGFVFVIPGLDFFSLQMTIELLVYLIIIVCLVFSAVFDLKYMILPDISTGILVGCAVFLMVLGRHGGLPVQNLLSALVAFGFLGSIYLLTKGKGMGFGDVKYVIFMGLFLGCQKTILAFYVAFIVGAIVGIFLMVLKKANRKSQIPFGPFLILGTFLAWFLGDIIIKFLISNF